MEIKSRAFPHPVLAPNSDDFTDGSLRLTDAEATALPERYLLRFTYDLAHQDLTQLILDGAAHAAVVVECRQNFFRNRYPVKIGKNSIEIAADELRGEVHVTPLLSASRPIVPYQPKFLNSDYDGIKLSIPRHGLLAFGPNLEFIAEPKADRLRRISSIMRVVPVDGDSRIMRINPDGARIRVEVSKKLFHQYQCVAGSQKVSATIAATLVLPVLIDVLHRLQNDRQNDWESWEALRWFQVIRARLRDIGHPLEGNSFNPMDAAQALLDSPFARATAELIQRLDLEGGN